ncbi:MAG: SPFH domain-containing protein [Patescibacteria group bacterium]
MVDHHESPPETAKLWKYGLTLLATASPIPLVWGPFFTKDWSLDQSAPLLLLGAYVASSIYVVQENEIGGIWVFQQRAMEVGPGFYLVPRIMAELNKLPTSSQQDQIPGEPELISKKPDDQGLLPGQVHPIRVTTKAGPSGDFTDDPLSKRLTLEVTLSIVWRIRKSHFFEMWERIPGSTWEEMRARVVKQLRDTGETQIVEKVSRRTTADLLENFAAVNEEIKAELQEAVNRWGIEIETCELQAPDIPKDVNDALARLAAEHAHGVADVIKAQAHSKVEVLRATGEAEGRERLAEAKRVEHVKEGLGMKEAADALDISGSQYYSGQIAKVTVGEGDLVLGVDLEAAVQAIGLGKTILRSGTSKETKEEA